MNLVIHKINYMYSKNNTDSVLISEFKDGNCVEYFFIFKTSYFGFDLIYVIMDTLVGIMIVRKIGTADRLSLGNNEIIYIGSLNNIGSWLLMGLEYSNCVEYFIIVNIWFSGRDLYLLFLILLLGF